MHTPPLFPFPSPLPFPGKREREREREREGERESTVTLLSISQSSQPFPLTNPEWRLRKVQQGTHSGHANARSVKQAVFWLSSPPKRLFGSTHPHRRRACILNPTSLQHYRATRLRLLNISTLYERARLNGIPQTHHPAS